MDQTQKDKMVIEDMVVEIIPTIPEAGGLNDWACMTKIKTIKEATIGEVMQMVLDWAEKRKDKDTYTKLKPLLKGGAVESVNTGEKVREDEKASKYIVNRTTQRGNQYGYLRINVIPQSCGFMTVGGLTY